MPFRFIAGNRHPDHDTIATFRATFLPDLKGLFVQVLLLAQEAGVLTLGTISLDGTKIHADASKRKAVSDKRLVDLAAQVRAEVEEVRALVERTDARERSDGLVVRDERARREDRLAQLAAAKAVIEERAREREALERAAYAEKGAQRVVCLAVNLTRFHRLSPVYEGGVMVRVHPAWRLSATVLAATMRRSCLAAARTPQPGSGTPVMQTIAPFSPIGC